MGFVLGHGFGAGCFGCFAGGFTFAAAGGNLFSLLPFLVTAELLGLEQKESVASEINSLIMRFSSSANLGLCAALTPLRELVAPTACPCCVVCLHSSCFDFPICK
jgi:hypothetical protein